jgi:acetyl-CoA carboxylase biotin carboxyl carrier protein
VVTDEATPDPGPFNVETINQLVKLMSRYDLSEVLLEKGQARIRLRRGALPVVGAAPVIPTMVPTPIAAPASSPPPAVSTPNPAAPAKALHEIKSPMVGTFYNREKPEAEPYLKKGAKVTPTTVVGLIEAMKLYNEVPAECSGTVVEVCVENATAVEYGTVLFRVDPAG